ncbi:MAG: Eco57I restriction-modification methylase domain-containing protein [Clostridiales bacterium]|nr:Eco57I restriction-modification methylase domain-containing protein [Clostridiales bacterium]
MADGLFDNVYNPDVLSCLANLSNDEVFTPPDVVNQMLDMLPQELFCNPDTTFLDPACKTGVFLREIAKRLIVGLEPQFPDLQERIDHIFHKQLFGIAITELTSLLSRRGVYCSKYPNSEFSVSLFDDAQGNIRYKRVQHTWVDGRCKYCGISKKTELGDSARGETLETHAYELIHTLKPEEIFGMKFDVIIGNPPYQLNDGGNGVSAAPIFQLFVEQAMKLKPRYLSMIIPARWYAGGKGLNEFREMMLNNRHVRKLMDYESSKDCFSGVNIAGGICYFLWDRDNAGPCEITNCSLDTPTVMERELNEFPILIRSNMAVSIVHKVLATGCEVYSDHAYPRNPFGFATNFRGRTMKEPGDIELLTSKGFQFIRRSDVKKNADIIDHYKVLIGRLVPSNGELDVDPKDGYRVITDTRIIGPGQINTETYLDIGVFKTEAEALHFDKFLKSKLPRFLLRQAISSLNVTRECFRFVPYVDFTEEWDDQRLYKMYGLTEEEIQLVEATIRPFESEAN